MDVALEMLEMREQENNDVKREANVKVIVIFIGDDAIIMPYALATPL